MENNELHFYLTVTIGPFDEGILVKEQVNFGVAFGVSDHGSFDGVQWINNRVEDVWHDEAPFDEDTFATTAVTWGLDTEANKGNAEFANMWDTLNNEITCLTDTTICTLTYTFARTFDSVDPQDYALLDDELKIYEVPAYYQIFSYNSTSEVFGTTPLAGEYTEHSYIFMGGEALDNHPKIHALAVGFNDEDHDHDHDDDHDHDFAQIGASVST